MTALYWFSLGFFCITSLANLRDMRRRRRQDVTNERMAEIVGLTPLQIQVAVDGSVAAFYQRIGELQDHRDKS